MIPMEIIDVILALIRPIGVEIGITLRSIDIMRGGKWRHQKTLLKVMIVVIFIFSGCSTKGSEVSLNDVNFGQMYKSMEKGFSVVSTLTFHFPEGSYELRDQQGSLHVLTSDTLRLLDENSKRLYEESREGTFAVTIEFQDLTWWKRNFSDPWSFEGSDYLVEIRTCTFYVDEALENEIREWVEIYSEDLKFRERKV